MKKTFNDMEGNPFDVEFMEHDINPYEVLFHVTLKDRQPAIKENGLLLNQPQHKALNIKGLLWFSYPINMNTGDLFRWRDESCALVVLDAKKLKEDGFIFYDDHFGMKDQSSLRNHLCIAQDIPAKYIKDIKTF